MRKGTTSVVSQKERSTLFKVSSPWIRQPALATENPVNEAVLC